MTMAWILQAVGGGESIGAYIKDVKGGNKTFVRTMIAQRLRSVSCIFWCRCCRFGSANDVLKGNFSNGIFDIFKF